MKLSDGNINTELILNILGTEYFLKKRPKKSLSNSDQKQPQKAG